MDITHIVLTARRKIRLPLWTSLGGYLAALHRIGRVFAGRLALFSLVSDHTHLIAPVSRAAAGRLAQATILSLRGIVRTPLAPSYMESVNSRSHMRWLLRYVLDQPKKHGMPGHPGLWVGSCLADLLGARAIAGMALRVREVLPDFSQQVALDRVGLPASRLLPADGDALRAAGASRLVHAAAAAFGQEPALRGNTPGACLARRTAIQISRRVGIPARKMAEAMRRSLRTTWRHRRAAIPPEAMLVVARRVALEDLVERVQRVERARRASPMTSDIAPGCAGPTDFVDQPRDIM